MRFVGLDLHKQEIEAAMVDESGKLLHRERFACTRESLEMFARKHLQNARVAVEATFHTWPIVALLEPLVQEVVISNPLRTKAIAQAKIKTDKVDALVLAQLLRCDYLGAFQFGDTQGWHFIKMSSAFNCLAGDFTGKA